MFPIIIHCKSPLIDRSVPVTPMDRHTFVGAGKKWQQEKDRASAILKDHSQWLHTFRQKIGLERTKPSVVQ